MSGRDATEIMGTGSGYTRNTGDFDPDPVLVFVFFIL
jgi:hypothetical protein